MLNLLCIMKLFEIENRKLFYKFINNVSCLLRDKEVNTEKDASNYTTIKGK